MTTLHEMIDDHYQVGDTRLMYGITVPLLLGVGAIALFLWIGGWWALAAALVSVITLSVTVAVGVGRMLLEEDDERSDPTM
jgi:hypothetical protein